MRKTARTVTLRQKFSGDLQLTQRRQPCNFTLEMGELKSAYTGRLTGTENIWYRCLLPFVDGYFTI